MSGGRDIDPRLTDVRVRDHAPGIWEDGNGHLHLSIPELHAFLGIPNTPEEIKDTYDNMDVYLAPFLDKARSEGALVVKRLKRPDHGDDAIN